MKSDIQIGTSTSKFIPFSYLAHITVSGIVCVTLIGLTATSAHAWWFTESANKTAVSPVQSNGLVLSPLAQRIIPEFILEPLAETEIEEPPSIEQPSSPAVVLTPTKETAEVQAKQYSTIVEQMLDAVNYERGKSGLKPVILNDQLINSAQAYAAKMQNEDFFLHESPDGSTMRQRNEAAGYVNWQWMGENLGMGQQTVDEVMEDWMNSEGHRKNILDPRARELGVGFVNGATTYWVQEFGAQF